MPNLAAILKTEILRLTQKSIKQTVAAMKAEQKKMRREIVVLRQEIAATMKTVKGQIAAVKGVSMAVTKADENSVRGGIRPTSKSVRALRGKFAMSQDEFSRLVGVGRVTVARWEAGSDKIQFRGSDTRASYAEIMKLGKKQAWARLVGANQPEEKVIAGSTKQPRKEPAKRGRKPGVNTVPAKRGRKPKAEAAVLPVTATAQKAEKKPTQKKPGKVVRKVRRK